MERWEKAALCEIHSLTGVGSKTLWKIANNYTSWVDFYQANEETLRTILPAEASANLITRRRSKTSWSCLERLEVQGFQVITVLDPEYSQLLQAIHDPPFALYCTGNIELLHSFCLGVVGSRNATQYGRTTARKIGEELAGYGVTVVSGMARGIDTEAHQGALNTGTTIAVLGSGLNVVYPRENQALFDRIRQKGLVISEFPLDIPPEPGHFPMRNRIISGLSQGVVVIEAREKSGALITADFALEQGRDVFAVPGPITNRNSVGTNRLIQQGAKLIMNVQDILFEYPRHDWENLHAKAIAEGVLFAEAEGAEAELLEWIDLDGIHFDDLLQRSNLDYGTLSSLLLKLELKGIVTSTPGNYYVKIR